MPRRIETDDEVRRFNFVFLGPQGKTLPWHARYASYGVGAGVFLTILLIEALTPLHVGVPPVWEAVITILVTSYVMSAVDHDKPIQAVLRNVVDVARAPRPSSTGTRVSRPASGIVKITKDPI